MFKFLIFFKSDFLGGLTYEWSAKTPESPYYAVIFSSQRTEVSIQTFLSKFVK